MTEQLAVTLSAASIGFLAAIFFCIGNAMNSSGKIFLQATMFYDLSEPLARSLAAQRAQYVIGALLLVISFLLQVWAALASATSPANLPQWLHTWQCLVLAVLSPSALIAGWLSWYLYNSTMRKILRLNQERLAQEKQQPKQERP